MKSEFILKIMLFILGVNLVCLGDESQVEDNILLSQFTSSTIQIDGNPEAAWDTATASTIKISMTCDLKAQVSDCVTTGNVNILEQNLRKY